MNASDILRCNMIPTIYLVKTDTHISESDFGYLLSFIDIKKKERILKQRIRQNAVNMLIGEILTRVTIKKNFGIAITEQKFSYEKNGKPYLCGYPEIHFNLSHSGKYVVCALSDKPIGIDVQKVNRYNPDVAKRVCSNVEVEQIENSADIDSEFTKLWTKKEAVLKKYGTGICDTHIKECLENESVASKKIEDYWVSVC